MNGGRCIICNDVEVEHNKLRCPSSGVQTIREYGEMFQKEKIIGVLSTTEKSKILIHVKCQKDIGNEIRKRKRNKGEDPTVSKIRRRSDEPGPFDYSIHCLFCGEKAIDDEKVKHPDRQGSTFSKPGSNNVKRKLLEICAKPENIGNIVSDNVRGRLECVSDVVAAKSRYHRSCFSDFCRQDPNETGNPPEDEAPAKQAGRPKNVKQQETFEKLCEWFDLEAELYSVKELHEKMKEIENGEVYADARYLKHQLIQKYGDRIFFTELDGKADVVCFKDIAGTIVSDIWSKKKNILENVVEDKDNSNQIIIAAAKLILNDLRSKKYNCSVYPPETEIRNVDENKKWLPDTLRLFMENIIRDPLQQASIGQTIVHAVKPRSSIPPILFGTAVELDHVFGSKWLLTELNLLGLSVSYKEVTRYKQSVLCNEDIMSYIREALKGHFGQFTADNVDIRVCDLDGKSSLHAMGVVFSSTGGDGAATLRTPSLIPRQRIMKVDDVIANKGIPIIPYLSDICGLSTAIFQNRSSLVNQFILHKESKDLWVDLLWHATHFVPKLEENHPGWTGYMTDVSKGEYPGKSNITILPIIDLDPTDLSCIYSTLLFTIKQSKELGIPTPIITFDLPLWVKANEIVRALCLDVVLVLGGFHTLMSFCGSIGSIMSGSGLAEALNTVYGKDVVKHITSGKAIARSLRANFMVETVLVRQLMSRFFPSEVAMSNQDENQDGISQRENMYASILEEDENTETNEKLDVLSQEDVTEIELVYDKIRENYEEGLSTLPALKALQKVEKNMISLKDQLSKSSRTAKLWIQYLGYVKLIKKFIRAERTGNWSLHLQAVSEMLNLFAASGHYHYAKGARLYLQEMCKLETTHPWVHDKFANHGYHTVRRSDRFWAGLWTDIIIEQVMMRSLKSRGGLTGGRGTTESVRMQWIHSMHRCASVHNAMGDLTGNYHKSSEQHVELGESRIKRDMTDMKKIDTWFDSHNPFDTSVTDLRSLSSGLCARESDKINCDDAEKVGKMIQDKLDGISFSNASISREDHARTLDLLQVGVVINKKTVHIDPLVLFARSSTLVERFDSESQIGCFEHEFTPEPTALFKDGLMRKPSKEDLRNKFLSYNLQVEKPNAEFCVIDGGAALHKCPWAIRMTFAEVAERFTTQIISKYSCFGEIVIVFDGYDDERSTKADEHEARSTTGKVASDVIISATGDTPVLSKREDFLRNSNNKKELIRYLRMRLIDTDIKSIQGYGDADTLICSTALAAAVMGMKTVVVSDDTDVLLLLYYHHFPTLGDIYFQTSRKTPVIPRVGATDAQIRKATAKSDHKPVPMWWNVEDLNDKDFPRHLALFAHAWTGCDTTSAIHGKGKISILSLMMNKSFQEVAEIFVSGNATIDDISAAGAQLMVKMYGGKDGDTPASLRHATWSRVTSSNKKLCPENLCPTTRATHFHSLRVYLQIKRWESLDNRVLDARLYGFYDNGKPIKTDYGPAPENVLNVIRCNCKTTSKNTCGTMVCSCKKHGLPCVKACGDCRGVGCNNTSLDYREGDEEEEDEYQ